MEIQEGNIPDGQKPANQEGGEAKEPTLDEKIKKSLKDNFTKSSEEKKEGPKKHTQKIPKVEEEGDASEEPKTKEKESKSTKEQKTTKKSLIPPKTLSVEEQEAFEKAPESVQKAFIRRERELGNAANKINSEYGALKKQIEGREEYYKLAKERADFVNAQMKRDGVTGQEATAETYIKNAMAMVDGIQRDPVKAIQDLSKIYNIDLKELVAGDPALAHDQQMYQASRREAELEARLYKLEQERAQQQQNYLESQVQSQTDAIAKILNPLVSDMDEAEKNEAAMIMDAMQANGYFEKATQRGESLEIALEKLADYAKKRVPSYQERLREQAEEERKEIARQKRRMNNSLNVSPSSVGGQGNFSLGTASIEEVLKKNFRKYGV